jgi:bifunctional lysine-specific demethylase and histidyl-hydroxylase NO66
MNEPRAALERCVGDVELFAKSYWGKEPLLRAASRTGGASRTGDDGFADLFGLPDVDHLVTETMLRMPSFRLVRDGRTLPPETYTQTVRIGPHRLDRTIQPERVLAAFASGATIVLNALHRLWPPVAGFCRDLELALTHPVQANAYVTPPTSQGFSVHHDTHDVFVLQTHGRKRWRVYPPAVPLPSREQPWRIGMGAPGGPILEAELEPGDCLYVPRGFLHDAVAREEISIHVTVGIMAHTWLDVWRDVMRRAPDHLPFREALPIGFARDPKVLAAEMADRVSELHRWLDKSSGEEAATSFARRFWTSRRPLLAGHLAAVRKVEGIDASTLLQRRSGSVFEVWADGESVTVLLEGRELRLPPFTESAVRSVAAALGPLSAEDLDGDLDGPSRLVLIRRLAREGVLEVIGGAD